MRLIFIRHGDPDYEHDSVTEKGLREISLLADKMQKEDVTEFYLSPKGRAQRTAQATLERVDTGEEHLIWDFMPSFMDRYPDLYSAERWQSLPFIAKSAVPREYAKVCEGIDALLEQHGYRRKGTYYEVLRANRETLVFFCHFGVTCVILSHLFNMSPVALLQHLVAAPSSVTTLYTEERERGIASFRCAAYGDVSHLYAGGEPPAFSARFCERYEDFDERH